MGDVMLRFGWLVGMAEWVTGVGGRPLVQSYTVERSGPRRITSWLPRPTGLRAPRERPKTLNPWRRNRLETAAAASWTKKTSSQVLLSSESNRKPYERSAHLGLGREAACTHRLPGGAGINLGRSETGFFFGLVYYLDLYGLGENGLESLMVWIGLGQQPSVSRRPTPLSRFASLARRRRRPAHPCLHRYCGLYRLRRRHSRNAAPAPSAGNAARPRKAQLRRTSATPPGRVRPLSSTGPPPPVSTTVVWPRNSGAFTLARSCRGAAATPPGRDVALQQRPPASGHPGRAGAAPRHRCFVALLHPRALQLGPVHVSCRRRSRAWSRACLLQARHDLAGLAHGGCITRHLRRHYGCVTSALRAPRRRAAGAWRWKSNIRFSRSLKLWS